MVTARSLFTFMFSRLVGLIFLFVLFATPVHAAVVINEFQIDPSGASQWAELYNKGPDTVDMSGWFIDDDGGTEKFTIPQGTLLQSNYCISFQSGNFNWNASSSDSARLLSDSLVMDEYDFSGSPGSGTSFGRNPDGTGGWTTFTSPTRDKLNSNATSCAALPTATATNTPTKTPTQAPQTTNTPTAGATLTPVPSKKLTPTKTPTPKKSPSPTATASAVLGVEASIASSTATPSGGLKQVLPLIIALLLVAIGLAIMAFVLVWKKRGAMKV